jgi:hemolysin D
MLDPKGLRRVAELLPSITIFNCGNMRAGTIRILLVDDQKTIRERLKSLLETEPDFEIAGMADNGYDAIEQVKLLKPDVVLMDMEMPDIDGVLATKIIAHSSPKTKVLVLSSHDSKDYVAQSIYAGAKGYILKGAPAQEIRDAVRFVDRGYMQIAPGLFEKFLPVASDSHEVEVSALVTTDKKSGGRKLSAPTSPAGLDLVKANANGSALTKPINFPEEPSELILDITAQKTGKSVGWYQAGALIIAGLGLTGGLYFLRQGLDRDRTPILSIQAQTKQLQETPFNGRIEAQKVTKINATVPGFISEVKVKAGDNVKIGDLLLSIRNIDAERVNRERSLQQQEVAMQQQKAILQQALQQRQQAQQQQQTIVSQQQSAAQRINELKLSIQNYYQTLAPLRQQVAAANVQVSLAGNGGESVPLRQKQQAIDRAKVIYERNLSTYERLAVYQKSGAISLERVSQAQKEVEVAKFDLDTAQADYDTAVKNSRATASKQAAQAKQTQLQQQLALKEQEGQLRQLQEQLRTAQADYKQLGIKLQQLRQQNTNKAASAATVNLPPIIDRPTIVDVAASTAGMVVELPVNAGDQIFTGNKLIGIADPRKLKVMLELEVDRARLLKIGQTVLIKVSTATDSQELVGNLTKIEPPNENQKQKIEVDFTNPKSTQIIGQSATVYFN